MPVDFDDSDLEDVLGGGGAAPEPEPTYEETDLEDEMSEAEARLEVAGYYKLLLNQDLFDAEDQNNAAIQVQNEMRTFARQRLAALLGVPVKNTGLNDEEIKRLRVLIGDEKVVETIMVLAAKLLKKPQLLDDARKQLQAAPAAVAPVAPPKKVKAPSLRRVAVSKPTEQAPTQLRRTGQKPVQQPQTTQQQQNSLIPDDQVVEGPHKVKGRGRKPRIVKTVVGADGKEIEMDLTRQTPTPPELQHLRKPMATDEASFNLISAQHSVEAGKDLARQLSGK